MTPETWLEILRVAFVLFDDARDHGFGEPPFSLFLGREIAVDPVSEILAKKLFYRPATLKPRDVYDLSAAIDLAPLEAARAVEAAASKKDVLLRRLAELAKLDPGTLLDGIVPYDDALRHAAGMVAKVTAVVETQPHPDAARCP